MAKKDPRFKVSRWKNDAEVVRVMAPCKMWLLVKKTKRSKEKVEGVIYKDVVTENYHVMEKTEFFKKFTPVDEEFSAEMIEYCNKEKNESPKSEASNDEGN